MNDPVSPSVGLNVAHFFWQANPLADAGQLEAACTSAIDAGAQVVLSTIIGHKADMVTMILCEDQRVLRSAQTAIGEAGFELADSYLSITEVSEYAKGIPEAMLQARLYPQLPPADKPCFCFYPMSKRRGEHLNWFTLPFEDRNTMMREHGASGRNFAGRVLQVVTGSAGLDDYEWGVTLFCQRPDDIKEVVYTMRFDEASAKYGEFGTFYVGTVGAAGEVCAAIGVG